ncbi:hypothetical protein [Methylobacterium sp. SD21]|uniref:hypothetical protein n=1 Tax=Methylobacterium litchii TaxID=3138810 RepID=UPI00313E76E3
MNEPLRTITLDGLLPTTHVIQQRVTAFRIVAADEIDTHRRVTIIANGEPAHAAVPRHFCNASTPVAGDWLIVALDGAVSHVRDDVFRSEATPVPRAAAGCSGLPPRVPRFPG